MLCFGACMIARVRGRAELPPPGFVLVAFDFLSGLIGPVLGLCGGQGWVSGNVTMFGAIFLNQAFVLFPLLGIGTFLLRVFCACATCARWPRNAPLPLAGGCAPPFHSPPD